MLNFQKRPHMIRAPVFVILNHSLQWLGEFHLYFDSSAKTPLLDDLRWLPVSRENFYLAFPISFSDNFIGYIR